MESQADKEREVRSETRMHRRQDRPRAPSKRQARAAVPVNRSADRSGHVRKVKETTGSIQSEVRTQWRWDTAALDAKRVFSHHEAVQIGDACRAHVGTSVGSASGAFFQGGEDDHRTSHARDETDSARYRAKPDSTDLNPDDERNRSRREALEAIGSGENHSANELFLWVVGPLQTATPAAWCPPAWTP
jgi:hypothetical protein